MVDYSVPHDDLDEIERSRKELMRAIRRAEATLDELVNAVNRLHKLIGLDPIPPFQPLPQRMGIFPLEEN